MRKALLYFLVIIALFSCSYQKKKILFKTGEKIEVPDNESVLIINPQTYDLEHKCQNGDQLLVRLLNEDGDRSAYDKLISGREDVKFRVHDSLLTLPVVGDIKVVGLTKGEILNQVVNEYKKYVIDPIIDIEFVSLSVNILGEVEDPGYYNIDEEMSLIDGLGLAGGISPYGIYTNVKIIRGEGEFQEIIVVDVSNIEALNNPKIKLMDKDIIYVEPRRVKQFDTAVRPYLFLTTVLSSAAAIVLILSRN